jgi:hypothetical protein
MHRLYVGRFGERMNETKRVRLARKSQRWIVTFMLSHTRKFILRLIAAITHVTIMMGLLVFYRCVVERRKIARGSTARGGGARALVLARSLRWLLRVASRRTIRVRVRSASWKRY